MPFQTAVLATIAAGIPGELAFEGPLRGQPAILRSADPANNVIGRAFGISLGETGSFPVAGDNGVNPRALIVAAGLVGSVFAGILANPKVYVSGGTTAGGTLASSDILPNETVVELVTEGDVWIRTIAASAPGDVAWMATTASASPAGTIITSAPGAAAPANTIGPIGTIERFVNTAAGIAVLHLEPRVPSVAP